MRGNGYPQNGFTLTELLVGLVLAAVVMSAVYSAYHAQQRSYLVQEQVAALQQNLRAAMYLLEREIRMAGCDPTAAAGAAVLTAGRSTLRFTLDIRGGEADGVDNDGDGAADETDESRFSDGDTNDSGEDVTYSRYDSGGDGDLDLGRKVGGGSNQPVAENIGALDFVYLDGAGGVLDDDGNGSVTTRIAEIRAVQVTLVARSERPDPNHLDFTTYRNQQGRVILAPQNDHFRRLRLSRQIEARNLGLN